MKKFFPLLLLFLLAGCSKQPFKIGGTELSATMPTQVLYLDYDKRWLLSLRYYEALTENEADETTLTVEGKSIADCFSRAEKMSGKSVLFLQKCTVAVTESVLERKEELTFFEEKDAHLYLADTNVALAEKEDAAAMWHDVLQREALSVTVSDYLKKAGDLLSLTVIDGRIALK